MGSATSETSTSPFAYRCGQFHSIWKMSAPLCDWMAAVMRGCRSLALMNSRLTSAPSALEASGACRLSSTSASGMKSTQRTMWSLVPCAKAGARPAAVSPTTAPVPARKLRRLITRVVMASASVDLLELAGRPLHGVLRRAALHAFGEHVDDDVLAVDLGGLGVRRPREAHGARVVGRGAEALHGLVDRGPQRVLLPLLGGADREALGHLEPAPVGAGAVEPLEEVLGQLDVLAVLHHAVGEGRVVAPRAGRAGGQPRVLDAAHQRLAALVLDLLLPALGRDVDRRAVERGGDLAGQERAVVVGVVPGQPALVAGLLPERLHELDGLHRALAVDGRLAAAIGLRPAEVPHERVGPGRCVAEGVAKRLAVGMALFLERAGDLAQLVVRLGERLDADLVEPRLPVGDQARHDAVGQRHEAAVDLGVLLGLRVEAALLLGLPVGHVADVDQAVVV